VRAAVVARLAARTARRYRLGAAARPATFTDGVDRDEAEQALPHRIMPISVRENADG
jgi:hypothetical protein